MMRKASLTLAIPEGNFDLHLLAITTIFQNF